MTVNVVKLLEMLSQISPKGLINALLICKPHFIVCVKTFVLRIIVYSNYSTFASFVFNTRVFPN